MPLSLDDFLNGSQSSTPSSPTTPSVSSKTPVSLDDFMGSSQGSATNSAPQQSAPSSGGFFSNLWGHVKDAAGIVGGKFNEFENATGLNHAKGALEGAADPFFKTDNQASSSEPLWKTLLHTGADAANFGMHLIPGASPFINLPFSSHGDPLSIAKALIQAPQSSLQGALHPDDMSQNFTSHLQPYSPFVKLAATTATDPLSYIPVGTIAKGVKLGADAFHVTPSIVAASSALRNAPVIKPALDNTKDILGTLFKKGYGSSPDTLPTMDALGHTQSADQYALLHKMDELKQTHGLTPSQMAEIPHVMDTGIASKDMVVNQAAKELSDTLSGGFDSAHGRVHGTDAELRNTHIGSSPSLQDLFSQKPGNQIRSNAVGNYYPHYYNNTPEEIAAALEKYNGLNKGLSTNGSFNKARTFPTLQDAIDHGLKPEMNPYVATGQRMAETSKAIHTDNAIKQLKYADVVKDAHEPGLKESTTSPFTSYIKNVTDPKTGAESSFINRSYMRPQDESVIQRALDPQGAKTGTENVLDKIGKYTGYDPVINLLKRAGLALSPQVHLHNLIDNGMYLGGAKGSDALNTMGNLRKGVLDPDYEKALASGAISSEVKGSNFSDALRNKVAPEDKNFFQKLWGGAKYAAHDALWDADKGLRSSLNKQALDSGATASEAAAKTNKFLVDYKNTTPFEQAVMKRIFPFYSWMKGNLPMQAEQWINNTGKQMFAHNAVNAASQALSGNDEHNGKMDTGLKVSDGSHTMFDPYIASEDTVKAMHDTPIPFLFNRMNPVLKMISEQLTNKKYSPLSMTAAPDKQYLTKPEIRLPGTDAQDSGYNARATIAHIANALNPVGSGVLGNAVGATGSDARSYIDRALGVGKKDKNGNDVEKPSATLPELLLPLTGGFSSRYNPDKEAKSKVYDDQQKLKDDITFKKSRGDYVSKAEKKAAYRKIK